MIILISGEDTTSKPAQSNGIGPESGRLSAISIVWEASFWPVWGGDDGTLKVL
jgi:hypothetical protein